MARNAVPFGKVDPILGYDISFYLFQLPLLQFLHGVVFITLVLGAIAAGLVYFAGLAHHAGPAAGARHQRQARAAI